MSNSINRDPGCSGQARAHTKSDDVTFGINTRGVWVGTGGDVAVRMANDAIVIFSNVQDGTLLPIAVKQIRSTDTTASDFVILL